MKKLKQVLMTVIAIAFLTTSAFAIDMPRLGLGVTGSYAGIDASGTELDTNNTGTEASVQTKNVDNNAIVASYYLELSFAESYAGAGNGLTFGFEQILGSADVSDKFTRTDTITDDANVTAAGSSTYNAEAEIDNVTNIYAEIPLTGMFFVKAGMASLDVNTKFAGTSDDSGSTPGTLGNTSVDGANYGLGLKGLTDGDLVWKAVYEVTDYDTLAITSSTGNKITADLDVTKASVSIGYRF
jgi:hypothetical protein